jgi:hypothetical protein
MALELALAVGERDVLGQRLVPRRAQAHQAHVAADRPQPGAEGRRVAQLAEPPQRDQARVLDRVWARSRLPSSATAAA